MKVVLLGLEFGIENMGCQALAYSFVNIFNNVSADREVFPEYVAVVYRDFANIDIDGRSIRCIPICCKKISFWGKLWRTFRKSDLIVDFTGGDSFSDIYGAKRFWIGTIIKKLALASKTPFVLGPQTIGPFENKMCRNTASKVIADSNWVFARDKVSQEYAENLSGRKVELTTDVAFSLPYERRPSLEDEKIKVGINVSGLLWHGGYTNAPIELCTDYVEYSRRILEYLTQAGIYEIILIPHVGVKADSMLENDINVCEMLSKEYSGVSVARDIASPMDAKSIIAGLNVFIGARMHATIAAFSSGVATIPFSYSRKFEGLYGNLEYDYVISAQHDTTEEAFSKTVRWIKEYTKLQEAVEKSNEKILHFQRDFEESLKNIIMSLDNK